MTYEGLKIKETRIKRGMSQEELADLAKVNLRTIQRIENDETTPRDKTLKLIYDALDIVVIGNEKTKIENYTIWSSILTLLIIVSTFIGWLRFSRGYSQGNNVYKTLSGWDDNILFFDYDFPTWLLSISVISIGAVVISHSLGLLKNKYKYIVIQLSVLLLFMVGVFSWSFIQGFELRPGLFIIVVASVLLVRSYRKKRST